MLTLLFASLAAGVRMVRAGMVEVLQTEYVQTARLNGVAERRVLWRYALRNALAPSVQVLAQNLQWLIGGIIITENVFAYPGIGTELVNAVQNRDVTVVQSVAMLIAVVYVVHQPARRPRRHAARAEAAGAGVSGALPLPALPLGRDRVRHRRVRRCSWRSSARTSPRTTRARRSACRSAARRARRSLGTDFLGRDVLSRLLYGGRSVIGFAAAATVLAYAVGLSIGLVAGYSRSLVDPVLMRTVDVMLAFPPLLFLLVLIAGAGTGIAVLVIGVAAIQAPGISRIVRTATLEVSTRGYVEAGDRPRRARVRGHRPRGAAEHPRARCWSTRACASPTRS